MRGIFIAVLAPLLVFSCGDERTPDNGPDIDLVRSELARNTTPDATAEELATLIEGDHAFALNLHQTLGGDGNLLASPLSIRLAFAMVYAGARGDTAREMSDALAYGFADTGIEDARLHNALNALDLALAARNDPGDGDEAEPVEIYVANAFWGQTGYAWQPTYLDILAVAYGAGVYELDFDTDPEGSRATINDWVEFRTRDRILDLLPQGSIDSMTAAVLTNAIYLKAPWADKFVERDTTDQPFTRLDGSIVAVPTMHQIESHGYAEAEGVQVLEMQYRGGELSMLLLLPTDFAAFEAELDAPQLGALTDALEARDVEVALPRFTFESEFQLKDTLQSMGMVLPFTGAADLSGMLPGGGLFIDEAYHKTFIAVDEGGTEAAAATAVVIRETSVPVADVAFIANRPFLFAIRDVETGALLFFGRVVDPARQ